MPARQTIRTKQIQLIQIARRQLQLDDDIYRGMLREIGGVESSADLDAQGRTRILDRFAKLGFVSTKRAQLANKIRVTPATDREKLLAKIDALLLDQGRSRSYIEPGMVKRICKVDSLAFCTPDHLSKLIAALAMDQKRQQQR